jgi:2-polyprenyl-3-methyl-5-hydroxy-6-metoxy-1,4-benzoquinol methylase
MNYDRFHDRPKIQKRVISENNYTYNEVVKYLNRLPVNIRDGNLNILDYGCGVGTISFYLAKFGNKVLGLDISNNAITAAKASASNLHLKKIKFNKCSTTTLNNMEHDQFDLVTCIEVLEHVENDSLLLTQLYKMIKHQGCLLLSTPSTSAPLFKLGLLNSFDKKVGHLRRYNETLLIHKLHKAGFIVNSIVLSESIIKNLLFCVQMFNPLVRFIRGPINSMMIGLEDPLVNLVGGSNFYIIATKP